MIKVILVILIFFNVVNANDNFLNERFPYIEGISLSGNDVKFPEVLIGKPSVLAVAFKQKAQLCINSWADEFFPRYGINKDVHYYEIPMLGPQWTMARNWIDGGMRSGVPKPLHDYTATYYGPLRSYYKSLGISSRGDCYMFVLDKDGIIKNRFNGYATKDSLEEMFKLIDSLNE